MHTRALLLSAISAVLCAASPHYERAIDPTSAGQIGVNPVTAQPGSVYTSLVGPMTSYYINDGSTTKWIGVNTEYLTQTIATTTVNNAPTSVTRVAPIVFITATAAAEGVASGDVLMIMEPKLVDALNGIAADVAAVCPGKKRQACDPRVEFGQRVQAEMRPGGRVDFDFDWVKVPVITATDVISALQRFTGKITGVPGILGALLFAYIVGQENHGNQPGPPKIAGVGKIPATLTGPTKTEDPTSTSTSSCPPGAPTGADRPICPASDCKGPNEPNDKDRKCSEGQWKDCPCVREVTSIIDIMDQGWLVFQQYLLNLVVAHDNDPIEAWCEHAAHPHSGKIPVEFCECGDEAKSLYFSIASSTTSPYDPCPYTTPPGPTITFQDPPPKTTSPPPPPPRPKCNVNPCPDVAKAKGSYPWVHLGTAGDSGKAFCHDNAGANVGASGTASSPEHTYNDLADHKNYDGSPAQFLIKAFADPAIKLNENDCNSAVSIILNDCDTCTNDPKFGGSVAVNGLNISIKPIKFIPCISC